MFDDPTKVHFLKFLLHEDEEVGWLYVELEGDQMMVQHVYNFDDYEPAPEFMSKAEARAHWAARMAETTYEHDNDHLRYYRRYLPQALNDAWEAVCYGRSPRHPARLAGGLVWNEFQGRGLPLEDAISQFQAIAKQYQ